MVMPTIFTERGSEINAVYDWYDAISNVGYKIFYCCAKTDSVSTSYFLTANKIDSNPPNTGGSFGGGVSMDLEFDADITFNAPAVIAAGEAIINASWENTQTSGTGMYAVFTLYHVNLAAVETSIGTATTATHAGGAFPPYQWRECVKMDVTAKSFAIGEKLRLNVQIWGGMSAGGSTAFNVYHDPSSRSAFATTSGTDLKVVVPFKVTL
jgi:hypothetical protein